MSLVEGFINNKIKQLSSQQLQKYAEILKISLSTRQADNITAYVRENQVNIFNDMERIDLLKKIALETDVRTAQELNKLFLLLKES